MTLTENAQNYVNELTPLVKKYAEIYGANWRENLSSEKVAQIEKIILEEKTRRQRKKGRKFARCQYFNTIICSMACF